MAEVAWTNSAIEDVAEIRAYIAQFNPSAAASVADSIIRAGDSLTLFPNRGRSIGAGRRELTTVQPYVIRYSVAGDLVFILRVRHSSRAPD